MRTYPSNVIVIFNCVCNYSCRFCAHSLPESNTPHCWTLDKITNSLGDLWDHSSLNNIGGCGEISILPYFKELLQFFDAKPGAICFSTNGSRLDVSELRKHNLYEIALSIHTIHEPTYNQLTGTTGNLPRVKANAEALCKQPRDYRVALVAVMTEANVQQMPELARYTLKIGADELRFLPLADPNVVGIGEYPADLVLQESSENLASIKEAKRILKSASQWVRPLLLSSDRKSVVQKNMSKCTAPRKQIVIGPTGDTQPCCFIPAKDGFGNVFDTPWAEIWNSQQYNDFRKQVAAGKCELCLKYCKNWG